MRNWSIAALLICLLGLVALLLGPWLLLGAVAFAVGLIMPTSKPGGMFWAGLLGGAALYGVTASYFDLTGGELPTLIAELFGLGSGLILGAVVALVGGLTAGLPALLGAYLRATFTPPRT